RDAADLIRDFGVLPEDVEPSLQMPCPGCPHHQECYGASAQAVHHIQIISFYPFYLLITRDYDFHGRDFSARLAGASARQLAAEKNARGEVANGQASRVLEGETGDDFLYPADDQRRFLELLYLKVRLLDTVAQDIVNGRLSGTFPGYFLTPADIGISFVSGSTLPNYWAFRLTYPGVERYLVDRFRLPGNMEAGQLCRYGFFWFFLLASNSRQQETMLFDKLSRLLKEEVAPLAQLSAIDDAFHPRQAWWEAPHTFETPWLDQWDMVISTGLELLIRGYRQPDAGVDQACAAAGKCLANLRGFVLTPPAPREQSESRNVSMDHDIYKIITAIKTSWQKHIDRPQECTDWSTNEEREKIPGRMSPTGPDEDRSSDQEKTVLISPADLSREPVTDDSLSVHHHAGAPVTTETAVGPDISDGRAMADVPLSPQRLSPENDKSQLEETQVIGGSGITGRNEGRASPQERRRVSLGDQARDRIGDPGVSQQSVADSPDPSGGRSLAGAGAITDEDKLEETVHLARSPFAHDPEDRPIERKREPSDAGGSSEPMKTGHHAGEDDFLTETVVLKPKNKR
ncbi:MAG: hypothetical protein V2J11_04380, partial [Desulfofustis sp.]|nr:hypothetical protein [Desulfofustis sp.]